MIAPERLLRTCLDGLIVSLLLIGLVSATPLGHLVQVTPIVISFALVWRRMSWSAYSALPLFVFWFVIVGIIWLFLLGITNIITGNFSPTEKMLTVAIALFCILGSGAAVRASRADGWARQVLTFIVFALLAVATMWISLQPPLAQL